jgi:NAD(P)H-flavin reductase
MTDTFQILSKQMIADRVKRMDILAPDLALAAKPGQFVLIRTEDKMMRVALPIVDAHVQKRSITVVFKEENKYLEKLGSLWIGDPIFSVTGPWGRVEPVESTGTVLFLGYEMGAASLMLLCRQTRQSNNKTICLIAARSKQHLVLESQMRVVCDQVLVATADGSTGRKVDINILLRECLSEQQVRCVYLSGPLEIIQELVPMIEDQDINVRVVLKPLTFEASGISLSSQIVVDETVYDYGSDGVVYDARKIDYENLKRKTKNFQRIIQSNGSA